MKEINSLLFEKNSTKRKEAFITIQDLSSDLNILSTDTRSKNTT
jgi:hypothetical protein